MTQVGIRVLKAKLSSYIHKVKNGETVDITDHGKIVARLANVHIYPSADGKEWNVVQEAAQAYRVTGAVTLGKPSNKKAAVSAAKSYANLLRAAQKEGGHRSPKEAMTEALSEYVSHRRRMRIAEAFGQIEYDPEHDYKKQRLRG